MASKSQQAARWVQALGIVAIVVLVFIDGTQDEFEVPALVYGAVAGVVIGVDPKDVVERIFGRK